MAGISRAATVAGYVAGFVLLFLVWHVAAVVLVRSALFPPPWPVLECRSASPSAASARCAC
jgi:ABC-type nitrate/sulfonate/bicarbonate transport system permease component